MAALALRNVSLNQKLLTAVVVLLTDVFIFKCAKVPTASEKLQTVNRLEML